MKKYVLTAGLILAFSSFSFAQQNKAATEAVVGLDNPGLNPGGNVKETQEKQRIQAEQARKREQEVATQPDADRKKYIEQKRAAILADKSIPKKDKQKQLDALKKLEAGHSATPANGTAPAKSGKTSSTIKNTAPVKP